MKHTPIADYQVIQLELTLTFLRNIKNEDIFYIGGAEQILDLLNKCVERIKNTDVDELKTEFWELSNEFNNPTRLRNIYKVKFKSLLEWEDNFDMNTYYSGHSRDALYAFIERHKEKGIPIGFQQSMEILVLYIQVVSCLTVLKAQMISLMEQCDAYAGVDENPQKQDSKKSVSPQYRIASKRKSDFIKLLSSMYDTKMFVDADGKPATNKQKMMEAFGEFLGDDFTTYSASLSQAKNREESTFMKPFKEIEKEALQYYNAVEE